MLAVAPTAMRLDGQVYVAVASRPSSKWGDAMHRCFAVVLVVVWGVLFLGGIITALPGRFMVYGTTAGYAPGYVAFFPFSELIWDYGGIAFAASAFLFLPGVVLVPWLWKRRSVS